MRWLLTVCVVAALSCATPPAPRAVPDGAEAVSFTGHPLQRPPLPSDVAARRESELAAARAAYENDPDDPEALIWLGRRTAYLGRYRDAIEIFTEGIRKHPNDARMYRHRGHRYITVRELDAAIADLDRAARLVRGRPDAVEPDGLPNARNIPTSTLQSNIWYHLGLAHYLKGDFEKALRAYRECLAVSKNPDGVVSTSHWLYMTLRRLNRAAEAEKVLDAITVDMDVIENESYYKLLLMYGGDVAAEELLGEGGSQLDRATVGYGVGNWYLYNGNANRAFEIFNDVLASGEWPAFGYIAAEAEVARAARNE